MSDQRTKPTPYRLRLHPGRHPYGYLMWGYEVYDPAGRPGYQVVTGAAWFGSWDAARRRGLAELRDREQRRAVHKPAREDLRQGG